MTHTLILPVRIPTLNQVRGRHWSKEHRAKKLLADDLRITAILQDVPKATGPRKVSLHVVLGPRRRQGDRDNFDKLLLDALTRCGLILDDSARGLVGRMEVSFQRGPKDETRITLTDVEE